MTDRYDAVVIGSGAGRGTLPHTLAPSGKRILLLERGSYLPCEMASWDPGLTVVMNAIRVGDHLARTLG